MATSGRILTAASKTSSFYLQWQLASQSIENNTSTVSWQAGLNITGTDQWYSNAVRIDGGSIAGNTVPAGTWSSISGSGDHQLRYGSFTIVHNADGTKSFSGDINGWLYSYGNKTASTSWGLPTIPRASTFTTNSPVDFGKSVNVTISRAVSSFTHTVKLQVGTRSAQVTNAATSAALSTTTGWCDQSPSAMQITGTVTVDTYNGSTKIGTKTGTITMKVPSSITPSLATFTAARLDGTVPALWGIYVQSKSKAALTVTGLSPGMGATLKSIVFTGDGQSIIGSTGTNSSGQTDFILNSGEVPFVATVTDSRNATASRALTLNVIPYKSPEINTVIAKRCLVNGSPNTNGTYLYSLISETLSTVSGKNTFTRQVDYRRSGTTSWVNGGSYTPGTASVNCGGNINQSYPYELRYTLTDAFSSVQYFETVPTALRAISLHSDGDGVAIGKVAEGPGLDVSMDTRFRSTVTFDQSPVGFCPYGIDDIYITMNSVNPSVKWPGTTWVTFGAGRVPVGVNAADTDCNAAGKTGGTKAVTLTTEQMPSHSHGFEGQNGFSNAGALGAAGSAYPGAPSAGKGQDWSTSGWAGISASGGGQAHSNMPPYIAVYMWQRKG